jgi:hypothetical protein
VRGSKASRAASPTRFHPRLNSTIEIAGEERDVPVRHGLPWRALNPRPSEVDELTPVGVADGKAEAQERQRGDAERHHAEVQHDLRGERREAVGHHVLEHQTRVLRAERAGGVHVLHLAGAQHVSADDAGVTGPAGRHEREDDRGGTGFEDRDEHHRQDEAGKREDDVDDALDDVVDPAPVVTRDHAEDRADQKVDRDDDQAHLDHRTRAPDDAVEDVVALAGAEPRLCARGRRDRAERDPDDGVAALRRREDRPPEVRPGGVVHLTRRGHAEVAGAVLLGRGDQGREGRDEQEHRDDDHAEHGELVAQQFAQRTRRAQTLAQRLTPDVRRGRVGVDGAHQPNLTRGSTTP